MISSDPTSENLELSAEHTTENIKVELNEEEGTMVADKTERKYRPVLLTRSPTRIPSAVTTMLPCRSRTFLKTVVKTLFKLIVKLWRWASSFAVVIFFAAWFYGGILPYIVFLVAVMSLGYHVSDSLLYQPDVPIESRLYVPTPEAHNLPFEAVTIHTKDRVKLHAYLIKQQKSNSRNIPIVVYFHGNAGNIGHRLDNVKLFFNKLKCNTLLVEYRGYGHSEGSPSEPGFYLDAQAALEFVTNRDDLDSNKIILFGRSLGGGVAIDLAARCDFRDQIAALIVENTFTSIPDLAMILFPFRFLRWIPKFCYKNQYESYRKISSVVCPVMFISGTKDELVPPQMMTDLYNRCSSSRKKLKHFSGGHNDTWLCKDYGSQLCNFIDEVLLASPQTSTTNYESFSDNVV